MDISPDSMSVLSVSMKEEWRSYMHTILANQRLFPDDLPVERRRQNQLPLAKYFLGHE